MSTQPKGPATAKKAYQKPSWEKQEIFERFIASCNGEPAKAVRPCTKILT